MTSSDQPLAELQCDAAALANCLPQLAQSLSPLELDLVQRLFETGAKCYAGNFSDREWTAEVKLSLEELATKKGLLQFPNRQADRWSRGGEWLFDIAWVDAKCATGQGYDWRLTKSLVLAGEGEWIAGEYDILADFLKLTFAAAQQRLFIYANQPVATSKGATATPADLCRCASPPGRGFRYLLVGFPPTPAEHVRVDWWTE